MKISVESGKRAPFAFENSKIKVDGSRGIYYNGQISISKDNKVIYSGGQNATEASRAPITNNNEQATKTVASSNTAHTNSVDLSQSPVKRKVNPVSLGIDRASVKSMSAGQKLAISDLSIVDKKLVIAVDLEYASSPFEVDFSMFLLDESGKSSEDNFIFYGNKVSKDSSIKIDDDLSLNVASAFDNVISLDLNNISDSIKRISLTATLYDESKKFADLKAGSISLISSSKKEVLNYSFTEKLSNENAIVICDLYLHNGNWKLQGIGQGFNGGLAALCNNFGVDTM